MDKAVTISLLMQGRASIFEAKEEILMAAERFKIRDRVRVSIDILPSTLNVTTDNREFIDFLDYCYCQKSPQQATA